MQIPHVNSRADAEAAVRHSKFAPLGHRGYSAGRSAYGVRLKESPELANNKSRIVIMLEEQEAFSNLNDILKVEHIDVFFIVPTDLAQSLLGYPGQSEHPEILAAIDDRVKRIAAAGKAAGC